MRQSLIIISLISLFLLGCKGVEESLFPPVGTLPSPQNIPTNASKHEKKNADEKLEYEEKKYIEPILTIVFDKAHPSYEENLYRIVRESLNINPDTVFEVISFFPSANDAKTQSIEENRAKNRAFSVLRSISQMGLPVERVKITMKPSMTNKVPQVIIYIIGTFPKN